MCTEMHQSGIGVREKGKGYGKVMDKRKEMHIRWTIRSSSGGLMLNVPRLMNEMILEAHRGGKSV